MKFIKRKSQRDDIPQYAEPKPVASVAPPPVAKDLPPTPLYARYARMTSSPSFESLNNGLDSPSASRFSAFNASTASGFGNGTPSLSSHGGDAAAAGSHGRAAGSSLLSAGKATPSDPPAAPAKPEPIKLKPRRVRTTTDEPNRPVSMYTEKAKVTTSSGVVNGESAETNGLLSAANGSAINNANQSKPQAGVMSSQNRFSSPPPASSHERSSHDGATSRLVNHAHTGSGTATAHATRRSTAPTPQNETNSIFDTKPTVLQKSILAQDDDPTDVSKLYNSAIRATEPPSSTSSPLAPFRPKEGPPIALLARIAREKEAAAAKAQAASSHTSNLDGDILVKPPSRRESLQQAKNVASEPVNPPIPSARSPSPTKATILTGVENQNSTPLESKRRSAIPPSQGLKPSNLSGVGTATRTSQPSNMASAAPSSALADGGLTASPVLKPVKSSEHLVPSPLPIDPNYPNKIPEKTPLVRPAPKSTTTSSSSLLSGDSMSATAPTSAASSVATVRQSRIQQSEQEKPAPPPVEMSKVAEARRALEQAAKSGSNGSSKIPEPASNRSFPSTNIPSRQSSIASAASSSTPSATSRSTATSPSGIATPDDMPTRRLPEAQIVSKVTLTKSGSKINNVTYTREPEAVQQPAPSPRKSKTAPQETPAPLTFPTQEERRRSGEGKRARSGSGHRRREKESRSSHESHNAAPEEPPVPPSPVPPSPVSRKERSPEHHRVNGHREMRDSYQAQVQPEYQRPQYNGDSTPVLRARSPAMQPYEPQYAPQRQSQYVEEQDQEPEEEKFYPIEMHLSYPVLLAATLPYLQFPDTLSLSSSSKVIRNMLEDRRELREEILERYLGTVGYTRWDFGKKKEPMVLTLRDLNSYLRGVSIPIHRYAEISEGQTFSAKEGKSRIVRLLASSTRAYTKVVLRLRAQAEADALLNQTSPDGAPAILERSRPNSPLIRAQSPPTTGGTWKKTFHSPLYRIGHAPVLRVFVPSPEGPWLSDASVLACEKELKRAGVVHLLKIGDVIWDTAVSDEAGFGNAGRLIWDGNYLIDLDYTFSTTGDVPPYLHSLSFPPAYFHKVLRSSGNPIVQLDLRPWGKDIASNLQLVQDRGSAETPQGGRHAVMRWTHRTRFQVTRGTPIPDTNLVVDAGWEGALVIEAEGTNEGLADLQLRCGMEWFKPQPGVQPKQGDGGRVFRLLRERSRPGEIWLRTVRMKERIS